MIEQNQRKRKQLAAGQLLETVQIISTQGGLRNFSDILQITSDEIITPVLEITDSVFAMIPSSLNDDFVPLDGLKEMIKRLGIIGIKRLDHIGFCYTVDSQEEELRRIKDTVSATDFHLYEMKSNDLAKWYFVGDASNWQDPMIELLPTLPNSDPELAFWMPHIHIDINTAASGGEIIAMIKDIFGNSRRPTPQQDRDGIHCVRLWLGVVSGVNIFLDTSTKVRNLQWVRANLLEKII